MITRRKILQAAPAAALLLAGCDSGGGNPTPPSNKITSLSTAANAWVIGPIVNGQNDSHNMPLNPTQEATGWGFNFPPADGVHYITQSVRGFLAPGGTLTAKFTTSGTGTLTPSPGGGTSAPKARLYFQKYGDDWSTIGYRWWSQPSTLEDGVHTLSIPLTFANWTSIYGTTGVDANTFASALANVINIGITFGADFAGHGLYSVGPVHFSMNSYTIT